METKTGSRLETLRETLKAYYVKHNKDNRLNASEVDRLPGRAIVRIFKVVFGASAYNAIKEAN